MFLAKTQRAELVFPVGRIHRMLRKGRYADRLGSNAAVYMAGVLEYLVAEILELSGNTCVANKKKRVIPRHIMMAVRGDAELSKLFENVTISEGGVCPNIEAVLLPKKTSKPAEDYDYPQQSEDPASQNY